MNYIEIQLLFKNPLNEEISGIHIAELSDMGFESFFEQDNILSCYIQDKQYVNHHDSITEYLLNISKNQQIESKITEIEQQNWNALWESNFEPTSLNERCSIIAPFHKKTGKEIELIIMPKMSFGTGHHETTRLMMEELFELNIEGKKGLDMGCGTGVLGILSVKLKAKQMDIIDIDEWAFINAKENIETNHVSDKIVAKMGDASILKGNSYDFILANINRNILLEDMGKYVDVLENGGSLSISGFLAEDIEDLKNHANSLGLTFSKQASDKRWQMMRFIK